MAILTIQRPKTYVDLIRNYQIFVDGARVDEIAAGSALELALPPGHHEVFAKIDWCRSNPLEVELREDRECVLEVGPNVGPFGVLRGLLYVTLFRSKYLYLRKLSSGGDSTHRSSE